MVFQCVGFGCSPHKAINVTGAWSLGYTGAGVNVMFADDALDVSHPDFADKFDPSGGSLGNEVLPTSSRQNHGTAVAGLAVAAANNSECGVGVAFGANLSFVRISPLPTLLEGLGVNDVYSNSWMISNCKQKSVGATSEYTVVGRSTDNICPFDASYASSPCTKCVDLSVAAALPYSTDAIAKKKNINYHQQRQSFVKLCWPPESLPG